MMLLWLPWMWLIQPALDGVRTGLAERLAAGHIVFDQRQWQRRKPNMRNVQGFEPAPASP